MDRDMAGPPYGLACARIRRIASRARREGAGRSRLLRSCNARPGQMTVRGAPPPVRAYPVTRPGWLIAQATLPGLPGVLRPVFALPATVVPTRLTPHCEAAARRAGLTRARGRARRRQRRGCAVQPRPLRPTAMPMSPLRRRRGVRRSAMVGRSVRARRRPRVAMMPVVTGRGPRLRRRPIAGVMMVVAVFRRRARLGAVAPADPMAPMSGWAPVMVMHPAVVVMTPVTLLAATVAFARRMPAVEVIVVVAVEVMPHLGRHVLRIRDRLHRRRGLPARPTQVRPIRPGRLAVDGPPIRSGAGGAPDRTTSGGGASSCGLGAPQPARASTASAATLNAAMRRLSFNIGFLRRSSLGSVSKSL